MNTRVWISSALALLLLPCAARAERPEVDCNALPDEEVQHFYELSGEMQQAVDESRYEEALTIAQKAMRMCTSDTYTEYMLARLYDLTNDCANAFYHYEILSNRPDSVKKENADIYKSLNSHLKTIKKTCGNAVSVEITCETPDTMIQIPNSLQNTLCPYYGKLMPGAYTVTASKKGHVPAKETIAVSDKGGAFKIPALGEEGSQGYIRVRCPRGASKFVLKASDGTAEEYVCPWEGKVKPDTYSIYLGNADPKTAITVTVGKKESVEHIIPAATSSCSSAPRSQPSPFAAVLALLGLSGIALGSRRKSAARQK